jgi:hypothetical protein
MKATSSPSGQSRLRIEEISVSKSPLGKSVRPIDPWNSTSPDDRQTADSVEEDHMPRCVSGAMQDLHLDLAETHRVALFEPAVRRERHARWGSRTSCSAPACHQSRTDPRAAALRSAATGAIRQFGYRTGVIDVPMRDEDLLQLHAVGLDSAQDPRDVPSRVDDRALRWFARTIAGCSSVRKGSPG